METSHKKIDPRSYDEILDQITSIAPFYTQEWNPINDDDFGVALSKIFSNMMKDVLDRLNRTPEKHFVAFLNMLGKQLLPSRPAIAPLIVTLAKGVTQDVFIPSNIQVMAEATNEHDELIFETNQNLLATSSKIGAFYSYIPDEDVIFDHLGSYESQTPFCLFKEAPGEEDNQRHIMYIGHKDLFNLTKPSVIQVEMRFETPSENIDILANTDLVDWEYISEINSDTGKEDSKPLHLIREENAQKTVSDRINISLKFPETDEDRIKESEINGVQSRWITCRLKKLGEIFHLLDDNEWRSAFDLPKISELKVSVSSGDISIAPDHLFHNDTPIDPSQEFHPFGKEPRTYDRFYIGSKNAFSKKGSTIKLCVTLDENNYLTDFPTLSYEYWNGTNWTFLTIDSGGDNVFNRNETVQFTCPKDISATDVYGIQNYWIRVRIVSGDYNQWNDEEYKYKINNVDVNTTIKVLKTYAPKINLSIKYSNTSIAPEHCLTSNNLVHDGHIVKGVLTPFQAFKLIGSSSPEVYIGFTKKMKGGPISLYIDIKEDKTILGMITKINYYYSSGQDWHRLDLVDGTDGFTHIGYIQMILPGYFSSRTIFGKDLYWIKAQYVNPNFKSQMKGQRVDGSKRAQTVVTSMKQEEGDLKLDYSRVTPNIEKRVLDFLNSSKDAVDIAAREPRKGPVLDDPGRGYSIKGYDIGIVVAERIIVLRNNLGVLKSVKQLDDIKGFGQDKLDDLIYTFGYIPRGRRTLSFEPMVQNLYLNALQVSNIESISEDILGGSSGEAGLTLTFSRGLTLTKNLKEEIWVNEFGRLSEAEKAELLASVSLNELKDPQGKVISSWVRWRETDDLLFSGSHDRHYEIDRASGIISFGDGVNGRIPPQGTDNIRASYFTGGGLEGNIDSSEISSLKSSVPFVEEVYNPEASGGGDDIESLENALRRAPFSIKNRGQAITAEDFEQLVRERMPSLARVKCIPTTNPEGETAPGWVTVCIVPSSNEEKPTPSLALIREVKSYLDARASNVIVKLKQLDVVGPEYIRVTVKCRIYPKTISLAPLAENNAYSVINRFLHPTKGGSDGRGWAFGQLVCLSDIHAVLERISEIDHAEDVEIIYEMVSDDAVLQIDPTSHSTKIPPNSLIYSGKHELSIEFPEV